MPALANIIKGHYFIWQVSPVNILVILYTRMNIHTLLPDTVLVICLLLCASHMIHMQCMCYRKCHIHSGNSL